MPETLTSPEFKVTPESLNESARKYRTELIQIPKLALKDALPNFNIRTNVAFEEVHGRMVGDMNLGPYDPYRQGDAHLGIEGRTLRTYYGNDNTEFDPVKIIDTLWGDVDDLEGKKLTSQKINKTIMTYLLGCVGEHLVENICTAKRNEKGSTSHDLFDGYQTIGEAEILAGKLSTSNKNFLEITGKMNQTNALDHVNSIVDGMHPMLRKQKTYMYMSSNNKLNYDRDYQTTFGSLPYNNKFEKTFVEGTETKCEMLSLPFWPDDLIIVSPKKNMLVGTAFKDPRTIFEVVRSNRSYHLLAFVVATFFGVQFDSIEPQLLHYTKINPGA